jgi:Flp pilus assembly protein TadD
MSETPKFIVDTSVRSDNAMASCDLGTALNSKSDLDGAIAEYRAALRLQPDSAETRYDLGRVLWTMGDREAAFEEFHTAHRLAPHEPTIRQIYYNVMSQLER